MWKAFRKDSIWKERAEVFELTQNMVRGFNWKLRRALGEKKKKFLDGAEKHENKSLEILEAHTFLDATT